MYLHRSTPLGARYTLHWWACPCGRRGPKQRSQRLAEADFVLHRFAPVVQEYLMDQPTHSARFYPARPEHAMGWTYACSCGADGTGKSGFGFQEERRAIAAHSYHANTAEVLALQAYAEHYSDEWLLATHRDLYGERRGVLTQYEAGERARLRREAEQRRALQELL